MNPRMIWANLAVNDLDRTTKFYTELGFRSNGRSEELTSFLIGENDFVIHFFLKDVLQKNINAEISDARRVTEVIFTLSAETKTQVDSWATEVEKAGGNLVTRPEAFGKGYYGFVFADPDGHRFNVFHM